MNKIERYSGAILWLFACSAAPVRADTEGFIDHWEGKIVPEYIRKNNPPLTIPVPIPIPSLSNTFDRNWSTGSNPLDPQTAPVFQVCKSFQSVINESLTGCNIPSSGELRGMMSPSGTVLSLKYIVSGANVNFENANGTIFGKWSNAKIHIGFDIEINTALAFQPHIGGSNSSVPTLSVLFSYVHFKNANVQLDLPIAPTLEITQAEAIINSTAKSIQSLNSDGINKQFGVLGSFVALLLNGGLLGGFDGANDYFDFGVAIDADKTLVVGYRKNGDPTTAPLNPAAEDNLCDFEVFVKSDKSANTESYELSTQSASPITVLDPIPSSGPGILLSMAAGDHRAIVKMCAVNKWSINCSSTLAVEAKHGLCPRGPDREPPVGGKAGCVKRYIWDFCPPVLAPPPD